jgi:hypothetical protein
LAAALIDLEVDLYVGSVPYGGGRGTIEAMGAGVPVLVHSNYRSEMFSTTAIVYDQAIAWRSLEDLTQCLRALTDEDLRAHARLARRYFEDNHTADALQKSMRAAFDGQDEAPPHRREYYPDQLQSYLDEYAAVADFLDKDAVLKEWSRRGHDLELLRAASLKAEALERALNEQASRLSGEIGLRDEQVSRLSREIDLRNEQASRLSHEIGVRNAALKNREEELALVYASRSWKITEPLRRLQVLATGLGRKK